MGVQDAGQSYDVSCDDILASHSDYLDGLLAPHEAARVQWHLASCATCGRYDRVVRRSSELVREIPGIEPSEDFAERLQHRLFHVQDGQAIAEARTPGGSAAATLAVAGVLALLAWSPLILQREDAAAGAMAAAEAAMEPLAVDLTTQGEEAWNAAGFMPLSASAMMALGNDAVHVLATLPGPHSPLVVSPPVHRTMRQVE